MTHTHDFAALQEEHGLEVPLADRVAVRDRPVVVEASRGFSALARGYLHVRVWELIGDAPGVTVLVEGSADGESWTTVHSWAFERDGDGALEAHLQLEAPPEYMRVTCTPTGELRSSHVSVGFIAAYLDEPAAPGGGGGAGLVQGVGETQLVNLTEGDTVAVYIDGVKVFDIDPAGRLNVYDGGFTALSLSPGQTAANKNTLSVKNGAGASIFQVRGDGSVHIPAGKAVAADL